MLHSSKIVLRPATEMDRRRIYDWLAHSDVTALMLGRPTFPDQPIPTYEEFCADYLPHYFDDSLPDQGRCFIIVADAQDVGVVAYNDINAESRETELDIWLASRSVCGKGYGPDALCTLCEYLHAEHGVKHFVIRPSRRNERAIASYRRAGFEDMPMSAQDQIARYGPGDYHDAVVMVKSVL